MLGVRLTNLRAGGWALEPILEDHLVQQLTSCRAPPAALRAWGFALKGESIVLWLGSSS